VIGRRRVLDNDLSRGPPPGLAADGETVLRGEDCVHDNRDRRSGNQR